MLRLLSAYYILPVVSSYELVSGAYIWTSRITSTRGAHGAVRGPRVPEPAAPAHGVHGAAHELDLRDEPAGAPPLRRLGLRLGARPGPHANGAGARQNFSKNLMGQILLQV